VVTQPVNSRLISALREQVPPSLLATTAAAAPGAPCFTLVFDREGYSPDLFAELHAQGIPMLTY
jgi:hypothetical protein